MRSALLAPLSLSLVLLACGDDSGGTGSGGGSTGTTASGTATSGNGTTGSSTSAGQGGSTTTTATTGSSSGNGGAGGAGSTTTTGAGGASSSVQIACERLNEVQAAYADDLGCPVVPGNCTSEDTECEQERIDFIDCLRFETTVEDCECAPDEQGDVALVCGIMNCEGENDALVVCLGF